MWANVHTPIGFYGSQVGFIDFMITPFWKAGGFPNLPENFQGFEELRGDPGGLRAPEVGSPDLYTTPGPWIPFKGNPGLDPPGFLLREPREIQGGQGGRFPWPPWPGPRILSKGIQAFDSLQEPGVVYRSGQSSQASC